MRFVALVVALVAGVTGAATAVHAAPDPAATHARLVELSQQITAVDRELDAIDAQLAAEDRVAGMHRTDALAFVARRIAETTAARVDGPVPPELADALLAYVHAKAHVLELSADLGAKNPDMVMARQQVDRAAARFAAQRTAELAELDAWSKELAALPARAAPAAVHDAHVRALRAAIAGADRADALPTDVPAVLRLAFDEVVAARDAYTDLARDLGPKHPELIAAKVRLDDAIRALPVARDAALRELDTPPALGVDITRRAELAARARTLRAEYEALLVSP